MREFIEYCRLFAVVGTPNAHLDIRGGYEFESEVCHLVLPACRADRRTALVISLFPLHDISTSRTLLSVSRLLCPTLCVTVDGLGIPQASEIHLLEIPFSSRGEKFIAVHNGKGVTERILQKSSPRRHTPLSLVVL